MMNSHINLIANLAVCLQDFHPHQNKKACGYELSLQHVLSLSHIVFDSPWLYLTSIKNLGHCTSDVLIAHFCSK